MCILLMIFIKWSSMIIIMVAHVAVHGNIRDRVRNSNYTRWIRAIYRVWIGATLWCLYHCWNSKIINSHGGPLCITILLCAYFELRENFVPEGPLEFILLGSWAICGISRWMLCNVVFVPAIKYHVPKKPYMFSSYQIHRCEVFFI